MFLLDLFFLGRGNPLFIYLLTSLFIYQGSQKDATACQQKLGHEQTLSLQKKSVRTFYGERKRTSAWTASMARPAHAVAAGHSMFSYLIAGLPGADPGICERRGRSLLSPSSPPFSVFFLVATFLETWNIRKFGKHKGKCPESGKDQGIRVVGEIWLWQLIKMTDVYFIHTLIHFSYTVFMENMD